jgi:nitroimidazol reductase NimA-like FMN-containing flavoprotein (pyridoxamine 5'-phosphate oxidase superfamily)
MKLSKSSVWDAQRVAAYLDSTVVPARLAVAREEYPLLCSLWYRYNADREVIQCVSHASSYLIKVLKKSTKVAFEIAENMPPYCGVRGAGDVTLTRDGAEEVLSSLLQRYLDSSNASLADWLLSRVDQEYVIEIQPAQVSAWDYSNRMS